MTLNGYAPSVVAMTLNKHIERTIVASLIAGTFGLAAWGGTAIASADRYDSPSTTMTVDGTDYPVCAEEDCSDQPGQVGVWYSKHLGAWLLELWEQTTYVIDSSVDQSIGWDAGYES